MATLEKQVGAQVVRETKKPNKFTFTYKGDGDSVDAFVALHPKGVAFEGYGMVDTITVNSLEGTVKEAIYACTEIVESGGGSGGDPDIDGEPLTDVWGLTNSRVEFPIESFCGTGELDPNLFHIRAWREYSGTTDANEFDLWNTGRYRNKVGDIVVLADINANTAKMGKMIQEGVEAVVRYYPILTRNRVYLDGKQPGKYTGLIGFTDTPETPGDEDELAAVWIKVQEDVTQNNDSTWSKVEAWEGKDFVHPEFYGVGVRWQLGGTHV